MAKTILVATDGSDHAGKAVALAGDLAKLHSGRLILLHVLLRDKEPGELRRLAVVDSLDPALRSALEEADSAMADASVPAWAPAMDPESVPSGVSEEVLVAIGQAILKEAKPIVRAKGAIDIQSCLDCGRAVESILGVAKREGVDIIVMGHRGLRNIDAITIGSVSNEISRRAPCDVVMIK